MASWGWPRRSWPRAWAATPVWRRSPALSTGRGLIGCCRRCGRARAADRPIGRSPCSRRCFCSSGTAFLVPAVWRGGFWGFALDEPTPDETTICRFRQALIEAGLRDRLLIELNGQLEGRGLMLKQGTMIDATLVAAQARPPK